MKAFHWLSDTFRRRNKRERLVVLLGVTVVGVTFAGIDVAAPMVNRWKAREAEIALRRDQLSRLHALVAEEEDLRRAVTALRDVNAGSAHVLLEGETIAVASSGLQRILNLYADQSQVLVDRVDFASNRLTEDVDVLAPVPAFITARGDIYGLVDLLFYLQHGEKLLVIDEMVVNAGRNGPGDHANLTWTIGLHGHYPIDATP